MKKIFLLLTFFISALFAKTYVSVSIAPEYGIVKAIGGDLVNIDIIVPKGSSPHTYEPSPKQMIKLQKSSVYFAIGVEFEKSWLSKFQNQNKMLKIIQLDKNINKINNNPHIWLNINNIIKMANIVYKTLKDLDPQNINLYKKNLDDYIKKLLICKKNLQKIVDKKNMKTFLTFHPAFTYFAKEFKLTQITIEIDGKEPSLKELLKVIQKAKKMGIKTVITSPEFSDKSAKIIANELGAKVVKVSALNKDICQTLKKIVYSLQ